MSSWIQSIQLPDLLLSIPRNPVTAVGLPVLLGMSSGLPTRKVVRGYWYNNLAFPPGRPPKWAFPVVWTTLYASMGYASHLAVQALESPLHASDAHKGLVLYYGQLALNLAWSPLFFVMKQTELGLVDILALSATVVNMTVVLHKPTGGKSTWLLVPYCAWLGIATYLNAGIVYLNAGRKVEKKD